MDIVCDQCGKDSGIEKSDSIGTDAARVQHTLGWEIKNLAMVGVFEWFLACSKDCMQSLLDKAYKDYGITEEMKSEAKKEMIRIKTKWGISEEVR